METIDHGSTSGGVIKPLLVDANGAVIVSSIVNELPAGTQEIGKVQARNYGWISANWQKDPLRIGYSGQVVQNASNTNLPAGTSNLNLAAVPAGRRRTRGGRSE